MDVYGGFECSFHLSVDALFHGNKDWYLSCAKCCDGILTSVVPVTSDHN